MEFQFHIKTMLLKNNKQSIYMCEHHHYDKSPNTPPISRQSIFSPRKKNLEAYRIERKFHHTSFNLSNVVRALASCLGFPNKRVNMIDFDRTRKSKNLINAATKSNPLISTSKRSVFETQKTKSLDRFQTK